MVTAEILLGPGSVILGQIHFSQNAFRKSSLTRKFLRMGSLSENELKKYIDDLEREGLIEITDNDELVLTGQGKELASSLFKNMEKFFKADDDLARFFV